MITHAAAFYLLVQRQARGREDASETLIGSRLYARPSTRV
jgi:hypothetical protein